MINLDSDANTYPIILSKFGTYNFYSFWFFLAFFILTIS